MTILVVDDDRVACTYLESALRRARGFNIEVANDAASALETLSKCIFDLLVVDLTLPDVDGFKLVRRLQREPRLKDIPIVIMSSDARIASKVTGFQLGIHDYFSKPINVPEFIARVEAILARSAASRRELRKRNYNLAGDFTGIAFSDLVNMFSFGQRSGVLSIVTRRAAGKIVFVHGEPYQVSFGNLEGAPAFQALVAESVGQFEFAPHDYGVDPPERRVFQSSMSLLMEGARLLDEARGRGDDKKAPESARKSSGADASALINQERTRVALPSPPMEAMLEVGLSDPFNLGEMSLLNPEKLTEWTSTGHPESRYHVVLVSDLAEGASALASLGSPMAEHHVAAALTEKDLSLSLSFSLKGDITADVLLCSQSAPAAQLAAMHLSPSVLMVAPTHGDWLSLGVEERVEIGELILALRPQCIVGLGNSAIDSGLRETLTLAGVELPVFSIPGSLSEVGFDFRNALVQALGAWGSLANRKRPEERAA